MKTLINKANPQLRITAPEIERRKAMFCQDEHYCLIIKGLPWLDADDWTLVEEEPTEGIKGNLEEIPSNVDLEKAAEDYRKFREECGIKDPIMLDEIEEAHYAGAEWQKKQKPAEWSEKDEAMRDNILRVLSCFVGTLECDSSPSLSTSYPVYQWLKSLRPQPRKEIYKAAKHDLAIRFMNYLDENRPEGKMSLSNGECEDIDKAFKENDWAKIMRYAEKYLNSLAIEKQ